MSRLTDDLDRLDRALTETAAKRAAPEHFAAWREVLRLYREANAGRPDPEPGEGEADYERLRGMAARALQELGGQAEPPLVTLADYDHRRYGPMLGVSDEGSAAAAVRRGALASPKWAALRERTPLTIGVAHDAERLGGVGEVVVGPGEYRDIRLACMGRLLTTTNVGTQANVRSYLPWPVVRVKDPAGKEAVAAACNELAQRFEPFRKPPGGTAKALTVLVRFSAATGPKRASSALAGLVGAVASGTFCDPRVHRLGLLASVKAARRLKQALAAVELAAGHGLRDVVLEGSVLPAARDNPLPGLASHFPPDELNELLARAAERNTRLSPWRRVDPATTARHAWQGLTTARHWGFELGKYGLVPLTFEEQREVVARVQYWFPRWSAAPVCFIDYPIVAAEAVYHGPTLAEGIGRWLDMVAGLGVRVVLIDTVKKSEGRRLLKDGLDDERGYLILDEVRWLDARGSALGLKVLWAGGITLPQAFEYGKLGVFGVYVTSAAAVPVALGRRYRRDPVLAAVREPTPELVARVKLLLEAGFLAGRPDAGRRGTEIEAAARRLIDALAAPDAEATQRAEAELHAMAVRAWESHLSAPAGGGRR